ncbi:hypothetical protein AMELA_G00285530 [Ameiurus melas]|uniref:Uncharacterized protein n=1 Tax=Ameiurus melas TaxID=219545 RepID=A0A7J5ZIZ9_AMEME|nr:hypothetical protein AMELA_G00285530 [Ameiurus melas]
MSRLPTRVQDGCRDCFYFRDSVLASVHDANPDAASIRSLLATRKSSSSAELEKEYLDLCHNMLSFRYLTFLFYSHISQSHRTRLLFCPNLSKALSFSLSLFFSHYSANSFSISLPPSLPLFPPPSLPSHVRYIPSV